MSNKFMSISSDPYGSGTYSINVTLLRDTKGQILTPPTSKDRVLLLIANHKAIQNHEKKHH